MGLEGTEGLSCRPKAGTGTGVAGPEGRDRPDLEAWVAGRRLGLGLQPPHQGPDFGPKSGTVCGLVRFEEKKRTML